MKKKIIFVNNQKEYAYQLIWKNIVNIIFFLDINKNTFQSTDSAKSTVIFFYFDRELSLNEHRIAGPKNYKWTL